MTTAKTDRRTERTRSALMTAFVDLVLSEGYEGVTVDRVAERANVGRSTFYLHYTSKDDILKQSMTRPSSFLAIMVGHDFTGDMLVPILLHFVENRRINRVFFAEPIRSLWVKCLAEMIEPRLAMVARHAQARPNLPFALIAVQIAEAQIGLITAWLKSRTLAKPEAIAGALVSSTQALVGSLLRVPAGTSLFIPGEKLRVMHPGK